jgi:DNA-binding beta-propeller fold protein YncE
MRTVLFAVVLIPLLTPFSLADEPNPGTPARPPRVLPGMRADGAIQLPNQWTIRPAGKQLVLGDFPVNIALHPSGRWLAVLHAGWGTHEIILVALEKRYQRVVSRVPLAQTFYGLCFSPDGKRLFASGGEYDVVHTFHFENGFLSRPEKLLLVEAKDKFICGGLAVDPAGRWLYAAGTFGDAVCLIPLDQPARRINVALPKGSYPYTCLPDPARKRLYVSLWGKAQVAVLDLSGERQPPERAQGADALRSVNATPLITFATESHPTEMLLSPDGKTLYVACANSTRVRVLDAETGKGLETINCALYPTAPAGNTPASLALTPDGRLLFVANGDANNVAVFNVATRGKARPLGFIPVGIYPTSVRYNPVDKRLYVANGRGIRPKANPHGPNPLRPEQRGITEYIAGLYRGTLTVLDMPTEQQMIAYSKQAYLCSPLRADLSVTAERPEGNPIPAKPGQASPIKHCIYIIRENRTYDQVFGDLKRGNGDPSLCLFPEPITPNAHRLAQEFVLLDNFYCDGEVSAEGHEWSMGAYCTDFVKKLWPLTYRGSPRKRLQAYPSEGALDPIARPAGGYLWDICAEAGVSYRSYGEWIANGKTPKQPGKARVKALEGHFDPWFRGFDLDYSDLKRADRFIQELHRFEREGDMPRLVILRLPNDHTAGRQLGKRTPTALVAENDLALGRLVEAVSHSKFWKDTAIFVIEDDAQNGPDHVDAHRTVALVISPYARRGYVDSSMYSTTSMVRTIELILGLRPMSQFDAAARPMYASFQKTPDFRPYKHVVPKTDLQAVNKPGDWGALLSAFLDFSKEDAADDLVLGEIVWRSVRGADVPMPPPVRAAFVFPHLEEDADED